MEIYKDMIEKLKFHKNNIINSFIKKGYYASESEIQSKLKDVDARLALFESYITKSGNYMNVKELNYCFEMIVKDIEILYKILEDILIKDYASLSVFVEAALTELEAKSEYCRKRCSEEINSTTLGTTVYFKANAWDISEEDEVTTISLGQVQLIEGMEISCFTNIDGIGESEVVFQFDNNDPEKSFLALPYNYNENSYKVPGEISVNKYPLIMPTASVTTDYIPITYEINFSNKYKIAGAEGGMQVTYKNSGETHLFKFANIDNAFVAPEDCIVEFFILDGNKVNGMTMEYSFTEAPISTNFSLQNGEIALDKEAVRIMVECQKGLGMFFNVPAGTVYASLEEPVIVNKKTLLYKGNWNIRDFVLREYVRTNTIMYDVNVYVKSTDNIIGKIDSIYIKEVTS
jgi:hypothetical protein